MARLTYIDSTNRETDRSIQNERGAAWLKEAAKTKSVTLSPRFERSWRQGLFSRVCATASLITQGINSAGATINDMLRPLSQSGDARLEGLIKLCLNLVFIAILVRFIATRR